MYFFENSSKFYVLSENTASNTEQVLEAAPHIAAAVRPPIIHHENYQN